MAIFMELRKQFTFLGIKPDGQSYFNMKYFLIIFLFAFCVIAMGSFVLFGPKSLMDFGSSFFGTIGTANSFITFQSNVLKRTKIFELIARFEEIIKNRPHRAKSYKILNEKIEICTKIVYVGVHLSLTAIFIPKIFASYWLYYTTDLHSDAFKQPLPMLVPFDWKTPVGYALTVLIQFMSVSLSARLSCCILCFLGGVCWLLIAFVEDIHKDFHDLNEERVNCARLKTKLKDLVEFHSTVKQFVYDFSEIYQITITSYYLWSISTICCSLFLIHFGISNGTADAIELLFILTVIFWSFVQMFIFCDFGENVSYQFSEVDNTIYFCDWYTYPKDIQKVLPIIIISAQESVALTGFANLSCTRVAFKKVVNGGYSYFTMIRRILH